ncbi:hypothetical protein ONV78_24200 [Hahella sp. CR1]|uniref:hypothetical protein n=1 Tax=Hahella sp. CR1 TaxID=2992807 RepID=UPI0024416119|nr:hypothetical protein [Hahella sp. CR1]MDG9670863.1 hypothetical protein [Hahella sp. CR1]
MDTIHTVLVLYELNRSKVDWLQLGYPYRPTHSLVKEEAIQAIIRKEGLNQVSVWWIAANDGAYGAKKKFCAIRAMATFGITFLQIVINGKPSALLSYRPYAQVGRAAAKKGGVLYNFENSV